MRKEIFRQWEAENRIHRIQSGTSLSSKIVILTCLVGEEGKKGMLDGTLVQLEDMNS